MAFSLILSVPVLPNEHAKFRLLHSTMHYQVNTPTKSDENVNNPDRRGLRIVSASLASNESLERTAFILDKVMFKLEVF